MERILAASALAQADAIRSGEISAGELMEAALRRAEQIQSAFGAFALIDGERALTQAKMVKRGDVRPFAGVPFAVKDLYVACAGLPLTMGSSLFGNYTPAHDSVSVERARATGLIVMGKTVTPEFGLLPVSEPGRYGRVRNPFAPALSAGGSSGGSACAVAAGALAIASASDGGGSIRIPAACCGLVGLKPSRGRVSLGPDMGEHFFGVELCVTRTVADTAAYLDAVCGPMLGDASWAPPAERPFAQAIRAPRERLRIALCLTPPFGARVDASCSEAAKEAARVFASLGHEVVEVGGAHWAGAEVWPAFLQLWCVSAAAVAAWGEAVSGQAASTETLDEVTLNFVEAGRSVSAVTAGGAMMMLQGWARRVVMALDGYDAVLSPTLASPPPPLGLFDGASVDEASERILAMTPFTPLANITGQPALVLPVGLSSAGLPRSVMLLGRPLGEATLLALGHDFEQATANAVLK